MTGGVDTGPGGAGADAGGPSRFAVIIGAMKAGTSSLFYHLASHPQVAASTTKEPRFFIEDGRTDFSLAAYRGLWDWDPGRHTIALEGSTGYTKYPNKENAAVRMDRLAKSEGVSFRFLYIMRDPAQRFVSEYMHARAGSWTKGSLETWIEPGGPRIATALYAAQLDEYYRRFPPESIQTLLFEDLRDDPTATVARAFRFLGLVPPDGQPERRAYNQTAEKRLLPLWMLKAKPTGVAGLYRSLVPGPVRTGLNRVLTRSGKERIEMTRDQERALMDILAPDLMRLEEVYGVDLARWPSARHLSRSGSGVGRP